MAEHLTVPIPVEAPISTEYDHRANTLTVTCFQGVSGQAEAARIDLQFSPEATRLLYTGLLALEREMGRPPGAEPTPTTKQ